jgi:chromatin remodeling complex protein RSC6
MVPRPFWLGWWGSAELPVRVVEQQAVNQPSRDGRSKTMAKTAKKTATKRKPNAAFMKAMQPDDVLAKVVGKDAMPRTQVVKKLWAYIKKNGLQDKKEKRLINADDALKDVFGGKKQVNMFEMTKLVNKHLS